MNVIWCKKFTGMFLEWLMFLGWKTGQSCLWSALVSCSWYSTLKLDDFFCKKTLLCRLQWIICLLVQPHGFFNCSPAVDVPPSSGDPDPKENGVMTKPCHPGLVAKLWRESCSWWFYMLWFVSNNMCNHTVGEFLKCISHVLSEVLCLLILLFYWV